jgi:putative Mg2+ transporter-C (MgtC) family protein
MNEVFFGVEDAAHIWRVILRLGIACILGGLIGFEREAEHKRAGLRTHMLVALGSALFTLIAAELKTDSSRIIQGIAAGVGFLGAGTIFKLTEQHEVKGLTTAAGIWVTAAMGAAMGVGLIWPAVLALALGCIILWALHRVECWLRPRVAQALPQDPCPPERSSMPK